VEASESQRVKGKGGAKKFPEASGPAKQSNGEDRRVFQNRIGAPKLCKPCQATDKRVVSLRNGPLFHTLINTCVENFTDAKYKSRRSARFVLAGEVFSVLIPQRQRFLRIHE
jgi:hypothetical protein